MNLKFLIATLALLLLSPLSAWAQCSNPAGNAADMFHNSTYNIPQYCDGTEWIAMVGAAPEPTGPANCPSIGDTCDDGSIYAGLSPDGNVAMYTTPADAPSLYTWNDGTSNYTDMSMANCTDTSPGTAATCQTGEANTAFLVGATGEPDYPFAAAEYCDGLSAHGYSDWYLPAQDELNVLYTNKNTSDLNGTFNETGSFPAGYYWSSSENFGTTARHQRFSVGTQFNFTNKPSGLSVRCVRRHQAGEGVSQQTQIVPNGLVGHWRLDETSGTTAFDSSGMGNDGNLVNGAGALTFDSDSSVGVIGRSPYFDRTTPNPPQRIEVLGGTNFPTGTTPSITFTFWAKQRIDLANEEYLKYGGDETANNYVAFRENDSSLQVRYDASNYTVLYPTSFDKSKWHHFAWSYDGTNASLYLDGILWDIRARAINIDTANLYINSAFANAAFTFDGYFDDVRIYNRALSATEIQEIYEARDGVRYNEAYNAPQFFDGNRWVSMTPEFPDVTSGLVGHWKLDETKGTTAVDSSGNGNDGNFVNIDPSQDNITGAVGRAIFFNNDPQNNNTGTHQYIVPDDASLNPANAMTISLWLRPDMDFDTLTDNVWFLMRKRNSGTDLGWELLVSGFNGEHIRFGANNGVNDLSSTGSLDWDINRWYHIVALFEQNGTSPRVSFYLDGVFLNTSNFTNTPFTANWGTFDLQVGSASGNRGPNGGLDDIRIYNRALSVSEIQKVYAMGAPVGQTTSLPLGCPNIGDVCDDGTFYAGLSTDGSVEMFVAPEDAPGGNVYPWNIDNTSGYVATSITDNDDGDGNTAALVTIDSDSVIADFQTHVAAQYCYDLVTAGADDWYLPSNFELRDIFNSGFHAIYGMQTGQSYWSSTEFDDDGATRRTSSGSGINPKSADYHVRCVRKGPAPRCANPYGLEGQMVFNTNGNVVQYCDGARWIAIGKRSP